MSAPTLRLWAVEVDANTTSGPEWPTASQTVYAVARDPEHARDVVRDHLCDLDWSDVERTLDVTVDLDTVEVRAGRLAGAHGIPLLAWQERAPFGHTAPAVPAERVDWTCAEWLEWQAAQAVAVVDDLTEPLPLRYADGRTERVERVVSAEVWS